MAQSAGSPQPVDAATPTAVAGHDPVVVRRAFGWRRLDQATYALAVGLAALLAIVATASLGGFELAGADVLGLAGEPVEATAGHASAAQPSAISEPDLPDDAGPWFATAVDERVRYDTERSSRLGSAALDRLSYDWETRLPHWRIDFVEGNDRVAGYTWSQERRIEVFVRPNASSADLARILAHELGHAVDVTLNSGEERQAWLAQRGASEATPWWPSSGAADFETGAGDFAECFAVWLVGSEDYRSVVGPVPSVADLALIAQLAD